MTSSPLVGTEVEMLRTQLPGFEMVGERVKAYE